MTESCFSSLSISKDDAAFVICEIALSHDGSLGIAHSMIEASARTGANAVKFQTHIADEESTLDETFRIKFSYEDPTRYDYWKRTEFTAEQWSGLYAHARDLGLEFISTPFSNLAVDILEKIGLRLWKIGSGDLLNYSLLDRVARTQKPIILSTGLYGWDEIDLSVEYLGREVVELGILQCTSSYPVHLKEVGINVMHLIRNRYSCLTGLSDHSGLISPSLMAIANGANIVEVHVTFDRQMFGPDSSSSLTFDEVKNLVDLKNDFHEMSRNPINKDVDMQKRSSTRQLFSRSLALRRDKKAGDIITKDDVIPKKPGTGIPFAEASMVIGRKLVKDVFKERLLSFEDIEK